MFENSHSIVWSFAWYNHSVCLGSVVTTHTELRKLDGLKYFCADNHMIVNETKSKVMCFGKQTELNVYFNDKKIEQVSRYKYLGNIVKCISTKQQDIFSDNYQCLCDQARKASFGIRRKTRTFGILPPPVMFYIFDALIKPITT